VQSARLEDHIIGVNIKLFYSENYRLSKLPKNKIYAKLKLNGLRHLMKSAEREIKKKGAVVMSKAKKTFIHEKADVQTKKIGDGTSVWQYSIILEGAKIGANCKISAHCLIENKVVVGNNVIINCGVQLWDGITIEDDVFIGPNVTFTLGTYQRLTTYPGGLAKTIVKRGASIGANSTILSGVTIGSNAIIGAGSVVTRDIPDGELWFGNPAESRGEIPLEAMIEIQERTEK
jgi:UDP-2-acetamido-3-amino-2,3-dideoxy-glucuronate N-acetyltransferase